MWQANNFEIITLSDCELGDVNFSYTLNVSDIIMIIEHIISTSLFENEHKILLADINQDYLINISDLVIIIEKILDI